MGEILTDFYRTSTKWIFYRGSLVIAIQYIALMVMHTLDGYSHLYLHIFRREIGDLKIVTTILL